MAPAETVERSVQDESVSETVVYSVADLTETDPVSLDPLYDVIDPDALDELFSTDSFGPDATPEGVSFTYCGCDVEISGDGGVRVSKVGRNRVTKRV